MKVQLTIFIAIMLLVPGLLAQGTEPTLNSYRSSQTGNWNSAQTWERFDGNDWIPAASAPSQADQDITIRNSHTVSITDSRTADQLIIESLAQLNISGTLTVNDGVDADVAVAGTLTLVGGTLSGNGTVDFDSESTFNWNGGTISGSGTITVSGAASFFGTTKNISGRTLLLQGNTTWTAGTINVNFDGIITNTPNGTFTVNANSDLALTNTSGGTGFFNNQGTLVKTGNQNLVNNANTQFNNSGQVNIQQGFILCSNGQTNTHTGSFDIAQGLVFQISAGTHIFNGTTSTGAGFVQVLGSATLTPGSNLPVFARLNLNAGSIAGTTDLEVNNQFNWDGGAISGSGTITVSGAASFFGTTKNISGRTLLLQGNTTWTAGTINDNFNGIITNAPSGTFTVNATSDLALTNSSGGTGFFNNQGTLIKTGTQNLVNNANTQFNNSGQVNIQQGFILCSNGQTNTHTGSFDIAQGLVFQISAGTHIFNGTTSTGSGFVQVLGSGTLTPGNNLPVFARLNLNAGSIAGTTDLEVNNQFNWDGGNISGSGTMTVSGAASFFGNTKNISGRTLLLQGNTTWTAGTINDNFNGIITNSAGGIFTITSPSALTLTNSSGGTGNFFNQGTIINTNDQNITVNGVVNFVNQGTIQGIGTFNFSSTLTNSGTIAPGTPIGELTFTGAQPFAAASTLRVQVQSDAGPGIGHDRFIRNAATTLAGTLNVTETGSIPCGTFTILTLTSGVLSGSFSQVNLPPGYTLGITSNSVILTKSEFCNNPVIATINAAEYFIDVDPGQGNATHVQGITSGEVVNGSFSVSTSGISQGFHKLGVRSRDTEGRWSLQLTSAFYVTQSIAQSGSDNLIAAEYFIDTDPGVGNGVAITLPQQGSETSLAFAVSTAGLSTGFHRLCIRTINASGEWSLHLSSAFYLQSLTSAQGSQLAAAEYFIDTDPGVGNATTISVPGNADNYNVVFEVPTDGLDLGFHKLLIRTRDAQGRWSTHMNSAFYIQPLLANEVNNLAAAEYFIDTDPGVGSGVQITVPGQAGNYNIAFEVPVNGLTTGFHKLMVRTVETTGKWSVSMSTPFYILPATSITQQPLTAAEWFVNTDPGVGNGTPLAIQNGFLVEANEALDLSALELTEANHTLYVRVRNAAGVWSLHLTRPFTICNPVSTPSFTFDVACAGLPTTFTNTSTNVPEGSTYTWDFDGNGTTDATGEGPHEFTYSLAGTFAAKLTITEPDCGTSFTAQVIVPGISAPVIAVAGNASGVCSGQTIALTAPPAASYLWSTGATTQSINVGPGSYFVTITNAQGCTAQSTTVVLQPFPVDDCGVCYPAGEDDPEFNTTCLDCAGVINGTAQLDACGICAGGTTGLEPCATDCAGVVDGTASIDLCGVCSGGSTGLTPNASCTDCNGEINGTAAIDLCGICAGGGTGLTPNESCLDCAGVPNGGAAIDLCGVCSDGNTGLPVNASCSDCEGTPNGTALPGTACLSSGISGVYNESCTCIIPLPDLAVQNIQSDATAYSPGSTATVSWTVANIGDGATAKSWIERIFIENTNGQNRLLLKQTSFSEDGNIDPGIDLNRSDVVNMPAILTIGDEGRFVVQITTEPAITEQAGGLANNTGLQASGWNINKVLTLTATQTIVEGGSSNVTVTRSGSITAAQIVNIGVSNSERLSAPAQVTILAGQSSRIFTLTAIDNEQIEGNITEEITASASAFESASRNIVIVDNDQPTLSITGLPAAVNEADQIIFEVSTNLAPTVPLQVFLSSTSPSRFPVPTSVTIAAGSLSANVSVIVPDNNIPQLEQEVAISAGAPGHNPASAAIIVLDDDLPGLELIIEADTISESNGFFATTGRLRRLPGSNPSAFTANLTVSLPNTLIVPPSLSLGANQQEIIFNIGVIDNAENEGFRTVELTAAIFLNSCGCSAPPSTSGFVSDIVVVADNDGPSLSLSVNPPALPEGLANAGTLRITRNTGSAGNLNVTLTSSNTNEITLPATAIIPNGSTFTDVAITTIDDGEPDGTKTVILQASATGFSPGVANALVTDLNKPDFIIVSASVANPSVASFGAISYNLGITNSGFATGLPGLVIEGFLSSNAILDASDISVVSIILSQSIPIGQTIQQAGFFLAPNLPGNYFLIFRVNTNNAISELNFNNNLSQLIPVTIIPDYTATASVGPDFVTRGTTVQITGAAINSNGTPAVNKQVEVFVLNGLTRREIIATTDASGNYSANFVPISTESGHYTVGASFPGIGSTITSDDFDILGVRINNGTLPQFTVQLNDTLVGTLSVTNLSLTPLTNFTISPVTLPSGAIFSFGTIPFLEGNATGSISYAISGSIPSQGGLYLGAFLDAVSAEGTIQPFQCFYYCLSPTALLSASISQINTSAASDPGFAQVQFYLRNFGNGASGVVSMGLPQVDWLSALTPVSIPSIAPGDSSLVVIKFTASNSIPFNTPINGNLAFNPQSGSGLSLPFTFQKVSEGSANLLVDVINQFTYFSEGSPKVEGAQVTVSNFFTGEIYAQGITNENGEFSGANIPQGTHRLQVSKEQHLPFEGTVTINPGLPNTRTVFINFQAVTFTWSVVPTGIDDSYDITLITQFQTNVPIPVVTVDVPDVFPQLFGDEIFAFNVTLTNHGLITANDVQFGLPTSDPEYEFIFNYEPADLPALSSIQVPVIMRLRDEPLGAGFGGASIAGVSQFLGMEENAYASLANQGLNCKDFCTVIYWYYCSLTTGLWQQGGELFTFAGRTCDSNINLGSGFDPSSFTGGLGCADCPIFPIIPGAGGSFNYTIQPKTCIECLLDILGAANDCLNGPFGPVLDALGAAAGAAGPSLADGGGGSSGVEVAGDAASAALCISEAESIGDLIGCAPLPIPPIFECLGSIGGAAITCAGTSAAGGSSGGSGPSLNGPVIGSQNPGSSGAAVADLQGFDGIPEIFNQYFDDFDRVAAAYEYRELWAVAYYGDITFSDGFPVFYELIQAAVSNYDSIPSALQQNILSLTSGFDISQTGQQLFFDRWNASLAAWEEGIFEPNDAFPDIINRIEIKEYSDSILAVIEYAEGQGFDGPLEMVVEHLQDIVAQGNAEANAVCAQVTIQLSQQLTMTREAFLGTFKVFNGHPTDPIDSLSIDIQILDENGIPGNGLFQIETQNFINLSDVSGTGMVAAQEEGGVNFLFIPTIEAAPTAPKVYGFGGSVTYFDPYAQAMITLPLSPVFLTVNPSPNLTLHYFLQRDVISDDPLTEDVVEPTVPAELAVLIENQGFGPAVNMVISSAQPEIIGNESGLAIQFNLIGSNLQGQPASLGLTNIVFGTIPPLTSRIGQWYFTSSLLGKFVDYQATVVHNNSFGNPALSLIQDVFLHELIHSIKVYGDEDDGIDDFLVNDVFDTDNVPDIIYLSQGVETKPVVPAAAASFNQAVIQPTFTNILTITPEEEGWNFVRINDPGNGNFDIVSVTRSDGQEIPLTNAWLTFVTLPVNLPPVYEDKFNFVDEFAGLEPQTYTVVWTPKNFDVPEVVAFEGVPSNVVSEQVTNITVRFNKEIDPATFDFNDLSLLLQGAPVTLDNSVIITPIDGVSFDIDLTSVTTGNGFYLLTVQAAGVADIFGVSGLSGEQVSWAQFLTVPAVQSFDGLPLNNTASAFSTIEVFFSLPMDLSSVTPASFSVLLNGIEQDGEIVIDSVSTDSRRFYLSNLQNILTVDGVYDFIVDLPGVLSQTQVAGIAPQSIQLILDSQGPASVALSLNNQGGLDAQHFPFIDINFGEPVAGFTIADVSLFRNGAPLQLTFTQLAIITQSIWKAGNFQLLTYPDGEYLFQINLAGIVDAGGNAGSGIASIGWTVDRSSAIEVNNLSINPDNGFSESDGITSGLNFNVNFDLSAAASQVTISQLDFGNEYVLATLQNFAAGSHSVPIVFPTGGSTGIKVTASGVNGGVSSATKSLFIDLSPLQANWQIANGSVIEEQFQGIGLQFDAKLLDETALATALSYRRNGAELPVNELTLVSITDNDFQILGLDNISAIPGNYELSVDLTQLSKFSSGIAGNATVSTSWTVFSENIAPDANAGPDQTITTTGTVTLDGSASVDPDGPISYQWFGPAGIEITGADLAIAQFDVTEDLDDQTLTFTLLVSDGTLFSSDDVIITIDLSGQGVIDCAGVEGGFAFTDNCGTCVGGTTGLEACVEDCNGDFGGSAYIDECGTCVGGNTGLNECPQDCFGEYGGAAYFDLCGTCVGGNTGLDECVEDCNGVLGGEAFYDECGQCVGGNTGTEECVADCNGDLNGTAYTDDCGICVEGNTGLLPCNTDCFGISGGAAIIDECGVCRLPDDPDFNITCTDCAGVPNGTALQGSACFFEGLEGTYDANCTCIANPVQEPCRYFLSNYNAQGGSDIYEFVLDEVNKKANLSLIISTPHKVSLALNQLNGRLYAIRESGNAFQWINVLALPPLVGPEIVKNNSVGIVTGAAFSANGLLYLATQNPQAIRQVTLAPFSQSYYSFGAVNAGDIAFNLNGDLNLISRAPQKVFVVNQNSPNLILGPAPANVSGVARKGGDSYLVSTEGSDELILGDANASDLGVHYQLLLEGLPFVAADGDMASGCMSQTAAIAVNDDDDLIAASLSNLYSLPNPTEGISTVVYQPATSGSALLEVYDVRGVRLATIFNINVEAGQVYSSQFDGSALPNGVYLYRLTTDSEVKVEKFMIAR